MAKARAKVGTAKRRPICSEANPWRGEPMQAVHPKAKTLLIDSHGKRPWPVQATVRCPWCGAVMEFAVNNWRDFLGGKQDG